VLHKCRILASINTPLVTSGSVDGNGRQIFTNNHLMLGEHTFRQSGRDGAVYNREIVQKVKKPEMATELCHRKVNVQHKSIFPKLEYETIILPIF
jgi:hypothetical protein